MQRDYRIYVEDMIKAIERILEYTKDLSLDKFLKNRLVQDAVIRNFEIIGEAVKGIPERIRKKYDNIEWSKIAGLRDILIHKYFEVNLLILWDLIENKLYDLKNNISLILQEEK